MTSIVLNPLEYKSSGLYRCEVSAEAPHFKVVYSHANMSVLGKIVLYFEGKQLFVHPTKAEFETIHFIVRLTW